MEATVYSKSNCPGCTSVKNLLISKGYTVTEIKIDLSVDNKLALFKNFPEARTVPQVIIEGKPVGSLEQVQRYLSK